MTTEAAADVDTAGSGGLARAEQAVLLAAHERRVDKLGHSAQYRVGELVIAAATPPDRDGSELAARQQRGDRPSRYLLGDRFSTYHNAPRTTPPGRG